MRPKASESPPCPEPRRLLVTLALFSLWGAIAPATVTATAGAGMSSSDFPILNMSPELHSVRHLAEYRGRLPPTPSRMTAREKELADDLWKLVNAGAINVRAPETSKYLFAVTARRQLSPEQAIAFFYRVLVGTFEPRGGRTVDSSRYISPLRLMDQALTAELQAKGVLLNHQVEATSQTISSTLFTVRKGHGRTLRQRIASGLQQLNDPILQADTLELFLVEDFDRDFVQWIYKD